MTYEGKDNMYLVKLISFSLKHLANFNKHLLISHTILTILDLFMELNFGIPWILSRAIPRCTSRRLKFNCILSLYDKISQPCHWLMSCLVLHISSVQHNTFM